MVVFAFKKCDLRTGDQQAGVAPMYPEHHRNGSSAALPAHHPGRQEWGGEVPHPAAHTGDQPSPSHHPQTTHAEGQ